MKIHKKICLQILLTVCLLGAFFNPGVQAASNPNGLTLDEVTLYSVSTRIGELYSHPYGSYGGGTLIYLTVTGHDLTPGNNKVFVGPYPCEIDTIGGGVNQNMIICRTTEAWDYQRLWSQPVSVRVKGKPRSYCDVPSGKNCNFNYSQGYSPLLRQTVHSAATAGDRLTYYGVWRVNNLSKISQVVYANENNSYICNKTELSRGIGTNSWVYWECDLPQEIQAGYYELDVTSQFGAPFQYLGNKQLTIDGQREYDLVVLPEVTSLSQNQGGRYGNRLVIEGTGFGNDDSQVRVNQGGIECEVQNVSNTQIECELQAGVTDSQSFAVGGSGVEFTEYNLSGTGIDWPVELYENIQNLEGKIVNQGTLGNWEYYTDARYRGTHMKGWVRAPRTGVYNFWLSSRQRSAVYINRIANNNEAANLEYLQQKNCGQSNRNYHYPCQGEEGIKSEDVEMEEGNYYWVEVFAYDSHYYGYTTLSLEIPEDVNAPQIQKNAVDLMQKFSIVANMRYEIWEFYLTAERLTAPFGIEIEYMDRSNNNEKIRRQSEDKFFWNEWTEYRFRVYLEKVMGYNQGLTVSREDILTDGVLTGYKFTVNWGRFRGTGIYASPPQLYDDKGFIPMYNDIRRTQTESDGIGGNYRLTYNGEPLVVYDDWKKKWTDIIPGRASRSRIEQGIERFEVNMDLQVYQSPKTGAAEGYQFYIWYRSTTQKGSQVGLEVVENNLTGGISGSPEIIIEELVAGSNRPLYEPIPYDVSFVSSNNPSVQVSVGEFLAQCAPEVCEYESFSETVVLQDAVLDNNYLLLDLTGNEGLTIGGQAIEINADTILSVTLGNLEGTLFNMNNLSQVIFTFDNIDELEAGLHKPRVLIQNAGYASYALTYNSFIDVPLELFSISPSTGSSQGGIEVTLSGFGFPTGDLDNAYVQFGSTYGKIVSHSAQELVVMLPRAPGGPNEQVQVRVHANGKDSQTVNFQYSNADLPVVTDIYPETASPVLKGQVIIYGSNFSGLMEVVLMDEQEENIVYYLNIIDIKPNQLTATLGGGHVGNYVLRVIKVGKGFSEGSASFKYIIRLDSVSPSSGSIYGGTVLTLNGENFSKHIYDNTVYLTPNINQNVRCHILNANPEGTEITCITPLIPQGYQPDQEMDVMVQGRLIEDSTCAGNCKFSYNSVANSPSVVQPVGTPAFLNGEEITIEGTMFAQGTGISMQIGGRTVQGTVVSDTQATFIIPNIIAGVHSLLVNVEGVGYAGGFDVEVLFAVLDLPVQGRGISLGGDDITIFGSGFNKNELYIRVGDANEEKKCLIYNVVANEINCRLPKFVSEGPRYLKIAQYGEDDYVCNDCLNYLLSSTPVISQSTPGTGAIIVADTNISISIDEISIVDFNTNPIISPYLERKKDAFTYFVGTNQAGSNELVFNKVPAGTYVLFVHVEGYGYAQIVGDALRYVTISLPPLSIGSVQTSLAGCKELIIDGAGFDEDILGANEVTVCGYTCKVSEVTNFNQLVCTLPAVPTENLQDNGENNNNNNAEPTPQEETEKPPKKCKKKDKEKHKKETESSGSCQRSKKCVSKETSGTESYSSHDSSSGKRKSGESSGKSNSQDFSTASLSTNSAKEQSDDWESSDEEKIMKELGKKYGGRKLRRSLKGKRKDKKKNKRGKRDNSSDKYDSDYQSESSGDKITLSSNSEKSYSEDEIFRNDYQQQVLEDTPSEEYGEYTLFCDLEDPRRCSYAADNNNQSTYKTTNREECWIGYDFGEDVSFNVDKFQFRPRQGCRPGELKQYQELIGAELQVSDDGVNWRTVYTITNEVIDGWNTYKAKPAHNAQGRYFRLYNLNDGGNRYAYCNLAEMEIYGKPVHVVEDPSRYTCEVRVSVNAQESNPLESIEYSNVGTAEVTDIQPPLGWQLGGDTVTITGTGFGTVLEDVEVFIDRIACAVQSVTDTSIVCITGSKGQDNKSKPSLNVRIQGNCAIVKDGVEFIYGLLYSKEETWGGESFPRTGDTIHVPKGETLIMDINTPVLFAIICEGTVWFADFEDTTLDLSYFIIRRGRMIVGSAKKPYQHKLQITLHGEYADAQVPDLGNKVLGCLQCTLDIHGQPRTPSWSRIYYPVDLGESEITIIHQTNWQVGDELVIAPTGFDALESEIVYITEITHDAAGDLIKFEPPLEFFHLSDLSYYGPHELVTEAEVGNLSRNVVIRGDDSSVEEQYGAHVMVHGLASEGTLARISHVEFRNVGQPKIHGMSAVKFHMNAVADYSYVKSCAFANSWARMIHIKGTSYLTITDNVGSNCQGHNILLEDGAEVENVIDRNLIVNPYSSQIMMQSDLSVAGIYITHPNNYLRYNHVAGSEHHGIWYAIKNTADGASANGSICPVGEAIKESAHNVVHSNLRHGLRINNIYGRQSPCEPLYYPNEVDRHVDNPSIQSHFFNYTTYKNGESGVRADYMGNSKFTEFKIADNVHNGFEIHKTQYSWEEVYIGCSLIVGMSIMNAAPIELHQEFRSAAISFPRTNWFAAVNMDIHEYPLGTVILESSYENNHNKLQTVGGKHFRVTNFNMQGCWDATKVDWLGPRYNVIFDEDGSFSETYQPTYITPYHSHFDYPIAQGQCASETQEGNVYGDAVLCFGVSVRALFIEGISHNYYFRNQNMKIFNLNDHTKTWSADSGDDSQFGLSKSGASGIWDCPWCFAAQLPTGYLYNIHWRNGLDFKRIIIRASEYYAVEDPNTILRFNFTTVRELYDVYDQFGGKRYGLREEVLDLSAFINPDTQEVNTDINTKCGLGDYHIDQENQFLYVCLSAHNRLNRYQKIQLNAVYCRETCPNPGYVCPDAEIGKTRYFTDPANYMQGVEGARPVRRPHGTTEWQWGIPQPGEDFLVPCDWTMYFDTDEFTFGNVYIDGTLIFDGRAQTDMSAVNIWVRGGELRAGSSHSAYQGLINIALIGDQGSMPLVVDSFSASGSNAFVVTGTLSLYGKIPETRFVRLAENAHNGNSTITVTGDIEQWEVGGILSLGGSQNNGSGFEEHEILEINGQVITLKGTIEYFHYGHNQVTAGPSNGYANNVGSTVGINADMRCVVGYMTRNIKIFGQNYGGHLQIYQWQVYSDNLNLRGRLNIQAVEFYNMGQPNGFRAGINFFQVNMYVQGRENVSNFKYSTVRNCNGRCVRVDHSNDAQFMYNIVANGIDRVFDFEAGNNWKITNNVFMGVRGGNRAILFSMYKTYLPSEAYLLVRSNIAQGSEGLGLALPGTPCDETAQNAFLNNEVGYARYGVIYNNEDDYECYDLKGIAVYASKYAVSISTEHATYNLHNVIILDSQVALRLTSGSTGLRQNDNSLNKAYINVLSRKSHCLECYNEDVNPDGFACVNAVAVQMQVVQSRGHGLEDIEWENFDKIETAPSPFGSMFLESVTFVDYRSFYLPSEFGDNFSCKDNTVFVNHDNASDVTAGHYLSNSRCLNCENVAWARFSDPKDAWLDYFGGCGDFDCTGLRNILIQDLTGHFFGTTGSIFSHNVQVGDAVDRCEYVEAWNGYYCQDYSSLSVLEWAGIGADRMKLMSAPVEVVNEEFSNTLNQFRESKWLGREPQNQRPNSFVSLVNNQQLHEITYSGTTPFNLLHKLQSRKAAGEPERFVVVRQQYTNPMAIKVYVNEQEISPFSFAAPENLVEDQNTVCGANNYDFRNRIIEFVVTGASDCKVQVKLVNTVHVNMRFDTLTTDQFLYDFEGFQTNFINLMSAFLQVSTDRLRIVGLTQPNRRRELNTAVGEGVELQMEIMGGAPEDTEAKAEYESFKAMANNLSNTIKDHGLNLGGEYIIGRVETDIKVAKQAGVIRDSDYFSDEDLVEGGGVIQEEENKEEVKRDGKNSTIEEDSKMSFGVLALMVVAPILAIIGCCFLGRWFVMKKQQEKDEVRVQNAAMFERKEVGQSSPVVTCENIDQPEVKSADSLPKNDSDDQIQQKQEDFQRPQKKRRFTKRKTFGQQLENNNSDGVLTDFDANSIVDSDRLDTEDQIKAKPRKSRFQLDSKTNLQGSCIMTSDDEDNNASQRQIINKRGSQKRKSNFYKQGSSSPTNLESKISSDINLDDVKEEQNKIQSLEKIDESEQKVDEVQNIEE